MTEPLPAFERFAAAVDFTGVSSMKITKTLAVAFGLAALAACNKQSPQENAADNIEANGENVAENIQANASNEAAAVKNQAENKADAVRKSASNSSGNSY